MFLILQITFFFILQNSVFLGLQNTVFSLCKIQLSLFHKIQFCWFANYSFSSVTKYSFACSQSTVSESYTFACFADYSWAFLHRMQFYWFANYSFSSVVTLQISASLYKSQFSISCIFFTLGKIVFLLLQITVFLVSQITVVLVLQDTVCLFSKLQFFPFFKLVHQNVILLPSVNANFRQNKSIMKNFIVKILQTCLKCMGHFLSAETLEMHLQ